jgi:hypothetical protein
MTNALRLFVVAALAAAASAEFVSGTASSEVGFKYLGAARRGARPSRLRRLGRAVAAQTPLTSALLPRVRGPAALSVTATASQPSFALTTRRGRRTLAFRMAAP